MSRMQRKITRVERIQSKTERLRLNRFYLDIRFEITQKDQELVPDRSIILSWLGVIFNPSREQELSLFIVSSDKMQELNSIHRKKNQKTDIISFPNLERLALNSSPVLLGDIVISPRTLLERAKQNQESITERWLRLFIHGSLHLLGYHHYQNHPRKKMERAEKKYFNSLNSS